MRKTLLCAAAGLVLATAGAAVPAAAVEEHPECRQLGTTTDGRTASGEVLGILPLTAGTDTAKYPVSAIATCSIVVDGVTRWSQRATSTGVAVVSGRSRFPHSDNGYQLCTTLDYTSSDAETNHWCATYRWRTEPDDTFDEVDEVIAYVDEILVEEVDPVACPYLTRLAPGRDPVVITPEGDVYVAGQFLWDCPPYAP